MLLTRDHTEMDRPREEKMGEQEHTQSRPVFALALCSTSGPGQLGGCKTRKSFSLINVAQ